MNFNGLFTHNQEGVKRMKPFWIATIAAVLVTPIAMMSYWLRNGSDTDKAIMFFLIVLMLPLMMLFCWKLHEDK